MTHDKIIETAKKYIGKTETPNNSGFNDKVFQNRMEAVGWQKGHAWCCYFCELVWKEAYNDAAMNAELSKIFLASATATYRNFSLAKGWTVSNKPFPGAIAIWRLGLDWRGHAAIVTSVDKDAFKTVEGNTNDKGGREGYIVAAKTRLLNQPFKPKGLNIVGFVIPK